MMGHRYQFTYGEQTAYAQVAALVESSFERTPDQASLIVDLGCGFGAVAEACRQLGFSYVGLDADPAGLKDLHDRSFEAHQLSISADAEFGEKLEAIIDGRPVAGMLLLDVIEHLTDAPQVLSVLHRLAIKHNSAPLILCLPNVTHFDLGAKLLQGRWDQTPVGVLDDTHVGFYGDGLLTRMTRSQGWHEVDAADFRLDESDQHFPEDNVALLTGTPLSSVLRGIRKAAGPDGDTVQLVRVYLPGPRIEAPVVDRASSAEQGAPFLTVLTRTQGHRLDTLQETLLCLAGQSCGDFEVLVLAHNVTPETAQRLAYLCSSMSAAVSGKFRVLPVTGPGRCRPLNAGVRAARGRYIAVLDDDDLVMGNWVEEFRNLAEQNPGRVLRAVVAEQEISRGNWPDRPGYILHGGLTTPYPVDFDLFDHFVQNLSPPCGLAFPTSCFRDLGICFDAQLPVLEDWDVLLQSVLLCGITRTPAVTAVYRRWKVGPSSTSTHTRTEWDGAHQAVVAKLDRRASVLPAGTITRVREMQQQLNEARTTSSARSTELATAQAQIATLQGQVSELSTALNRLHVEYRESTSWKVTTPLRRLSEAARSTVHGARRP